MDTATAGLGVGTTPIPDDDHGADLPLTMSASVVLTSLPRDAHQALADAEAVDTGKGRSIYAKVSFVKPLVRTNIRDEASIQYYYSFLFNVLLAKQFNFLLCAYDTVIASSCLTF
jgi:ubiquitin-like protein ATG12